MATTARMILWQVGAWWIQPKYHEKSSISAVEWVCLKIGYPIPSTGSSFFSQLKYFQRAILDIPSFINFNGYFRSRIIPSQSSLPVQVGPVPSETALPAAWLRTPEDDLLWSWSLPAPAPNTNKQQQIPRNTNTLAKGGCDKAVQIESR